MINRRGDTQHAFVKSEAPSSTVNAVVLGDEIVNSVTLHRRQEMVIYPIIALRVDSAQNWLDK
jgi:hypothetical protein